MTQWQEELMATTFNCLELHHCPPQQTNNNQRVQRSFVVVTTDNRMFFLQTARHPPIILRSLFRSQWTTPVTHLLISGPGSAESPPEFVANYCCDRLSPAGCHKFKLLSALGLLWLSPIIRLLIYKVQLLLQWQFQRQTKQNGGWGTRHSSCETVKDARDKSTASPTQHWKFSI